ncbi:hypothetical protein [Paenibacillus sp. FSL W8-0194]|uniref:hypothetical protein n=1 Tax=Paenibacillus sp. FSL W8-0194 TaxID=2921711 RepID=UPI0030D6CFB1
MDSVTPKNSSVAAGQVGVVKEWTVPDKSIVGGIIEFSLSNTVSNTAMNYRVRTVAANNTTADLTKNQNPVVNYYSEDGATHPRGSWNFADIKSSVSYSAGSGWKYYNASNGDTDDLMKASNSYKDPEAPPAQGPASSNKGHYGIKYNLDVTLNNTTGAEKTVKVYVAARGTNYYAGAVRWSGEGVTYKVPKLESYLKVSGNEQPAVEVATVKLAPGASITRTITMSTAGGASTPALIAFQTV